MPLLNARPLVWTERECCDEAVFACRESESRSGTIPGIATVLNNTDSLLPSGSFAQSLARGAEPRKNSVILVRRGRIELPPPLRD